MRFARSCRAGHLGILLIDMFIFIAFYLVFFIAFQFVHYIKCSFAFVVSVTVLCFGEHSPLIFPVIIVQLVLYPRLVLKGHAHRCPHIPHGQKRRRDRPNAVPHEQPRRDGHAQLALPGFVQQRPHQVDEGAHAHVDREVRPEVERDA